ncbi:MULTISPECIES: hypothetical protein [Paenibacillus]|uniref:hypothetical protein n=1 Tax=Paenibacillus TaxID=44249 RepID=UPI00203EB4ED|nr:hypothetical protein [Paenibacillus lactis]MCM3495968.1 hypothetical protein [Paenibacillus lactis]
MKMNKLGTMTLSVRLIILGVGLLLPLLSIFISNYEPIGDDRYALGLPFRFLNYYGETLPAYKYELFTWDVFTRHVLFNAPLYFLNAVLIYLVIFAVIKIIVIVRTRNTKRSNPVE